MIIQSADVVRIAPLSRTQRLSERYRRGRLPFVLAAAALGLGGSFAQGDSFGVAGLNLDGFGTLGVVHSNYDEADFVVDPLTKPFGAGHTHAWDMDQDTRLGLQVSYAFSDQLSATAQAITREQYNHTYEPVITWANLKYDISADWSVRVGRVLSPTYLMSDTQDVGYAIPWVRIPAEIYIELPVENIDGIDVAYHRNFGPITNTVQLLYGENKESTVGNYIFENTGIKAIADSIEAGATTIHIGYQTMHYTVGLGGVGASPNFKFSTTEIGVMYDPGGWYVTGEAVWTHDQLVGHTLGTDFGGGYRIGSVTLYAVQSAFTNQSLGLESGYPFFDERTTAVGLRWDFRKNLDFKLQDNRIKNGSLSTPTSFVNVQPGARLGDVANVISATVDVLF